MQIRLECYENELDEMVARVRQVFEVKSVSKFEPNTRQTSITTICEGRVFVKVKDFDPQHRNFKGEFAEFLVGDMFSYINTISKEFGYPVDRELPLMKEFYETCPRIETTKQMVELVNAWKIFVINRLAIYLKEQGK